MRPTPFQRTSMIAALAALIVSGCTTENHNAGYGYCDETGCYQCDLGDNCWAIPNERCSMAADCATGACTSIGCAADCASDTECADGESCVDGFCAPWGFTKVTPLIPPTSCTADTDCQADQFCETDSGVCKAKCTSDEECGPGMVCSACGKCQPKGTPATCGTVPTFCSDAVPCGAGKSCQQGRCHFQCTATDSCPVGQVCAAGLCTDDPSPTVPQCALDLDCGDGSCINGYCHISCKTSGDCGAKNVCQMSVCQPDYSAAS